MRKIGQRSRAGNLARENHIVATSRTHPMLIGSQVDPHAAFQGCRQVQLRLLTTICVLGETSSIGPNS